MYLLSLICSLFMHSGASFAMEFLPEKPPIPKDNPQSPAKVKLGKMLYFDTRLSADNKISCNSCHDVTKGGVDGLPVSLGIGTQKGGRNAPTVWNSAYLSVQFWDGRAPSLEEQAKGPITNPIEMGMTDHNLAVQKIKVVKGYEPLFKKAFPRDKNPITIDNIAKAIASFERTLITPNSPVDMYLKGDKRLLTAEAVEGMQLFQTVGCVACHSGPNFAGPALPTGQGFYMKFPTFPNADLEKKYKFSEDLGRYAVTKNAADKNMWRVPTLRNIHLTGPYFHNGKVDSIDEAVKIMAKLQLNKDLKSSEVEKIVAFLKGLNGERGEIKPPELPN